MAKDKKKSEKEDGMILTGWEVKTIADRIGKLPGATMDDIDAILECMKVFDEDEVKGIKDDEEIHIELSEKTLRIMWNNFRNPQIIVRWPIDRKTTEMRKKFEELINKKDKG